MGAALKFFLNALKALFLSPFYIVYFLVFLVYGFFNHLIGEVRVIISGFKYASDKENKYQNKLKKKTTSANNGGVK